MIPFLRENTIVSMLFRMYLSCHRRIFLIHRLYDIYAHNEVILRFGLPPLDFV